MSDSIYGERVRTTTTPTLTDPSPPRTCAGVMQRSTTIAASHDAKLLAILDSDHHEPAMVAFARKERESHWMESVRTCSQELEEILRPPISLFGHTAPREKCVWR